MRKINVKRLPLIDLSLPGRLAFYLMGFVMMSPVIGLVLYGGFKYLIADQPGYCSKQKRILSDEEYFQIVLGDLMKSDVMKLEPSETTVQTYLTNHPKCCHVYRGDNPVVDRGLFNSDGVEVLITYELSEAGKKHMGAGQGAGSNTHYSYISGLDGCGKYIGSTGMTTTPSD